MGVFVTLLIILIIVLVFCVKIVPQSKAYLIIKLGRMVYSLWFLLLTELVILLI